MFKKDYCTELVHQEKYQELDDYLIECNKKDPYDKEFLLTLVPWLDFNEFTWHEYAVERMQIYEEKYPEHYEQKQTVALLYVIYRIEVGSMWKT